MAQSCFFSTFSVKCDSLKNDSLQIHRPFYLAHFSRKNQRIYIKLKFVLWYRTFVINLSVVFRPVLGGEYHKNLRTTAGLVLIFLALSFVFSILIFV